MARHRYGASRRKLVGLVVLAALAALTLALTGCIASVNAPTATSGTFGAATVRQGVTAADMGSNQNLDEYGVFYSKSQADVTAVDDSNSSAVDVDADIISQPYVSKVSVVTDQDITPSQVGTFTINLKGLTPGATYYYRFYTIGRDNTGFRYRTLYAVASHKVADPTLKSITLSAGKLAPAFTKLRYSYYTVISATTKSTKVTVAPTASTSKVQMKIGTGAWSTIKYKTVTLLRGQTKTVYIRVTASNNKAICNYSVKVTRRK